MVAISNESLAPLSDWIQRRLAADGTPGVSLAVTDRAGIVHTATSRLVEVVNERHALV